MKRTLLTISFISLAVFLAACTAQPAVNTNTGPAANTNNEPTANTNNQPTAGGCDFIDGQCCLGENCAIVMPNCLVGTTPQVRGCDENCLPIAECVPDSAEAADNFVTYKNSAPAFQFKYPKAWEVAVGTTGVRTTITFKDLKNGYEGAGFVVAALSYMPNQGGVSLSEWASEIQKSGGFIPVLTKKPIEISGVIAEHLILPESEAGPRYLFISADKLTMYDWQFTTVTSVTIQTMIDSFAFIQ